MPPFKLEATGELLTANAGLALFGEFLRGLGFSRWLRQEMPKPGSGRGYVADAYVTPLVLMLAGGGRSLEELRTLKNDRALATVLQRGALPSTDAVGDWLRRSGEEVGLAGLSRINQRIVATRLGQSGITAHTLDGDASQIEVEKEGAQFTYKGEQGYMPMIGHLANGVYTSAPFTPLVLGVYRWIANYGGDAGNTARQISAMPRTRECWSWLLPLAAIYPRLQSGR